MRRLLSLSLAFALTVTSTVSVTASAPVLKASPPSVKFGTRPIGTETLKAARVTNRNDVALNLLVSPERMPDEFAFGLLPGSTCPVLAPAALAPGESCDAIVQFRPTEFFAGQLQVATLRATATDPGTGAEVATLLIDFTGTGR
jgi:hypothetical protein